MSSLDQSVTAKIQSGVLPKSTEARVGRGRGGHCALCHVVIRPPDTEVEVEVESRREYSIRPASISGETT